MLKKQPIIFKNINLNDKRGILDKFLDEKTIKSLNFNVVEIQISKSKKNVFRGIYMQTGKFKEAKLIKLLRGKLVWFAIDLRKKSNTFGKLFSFNLKNNQFLYLPRGFAHASYSIEFSEVLIIADNKYNNKSSIGINYKDEKFYKKIRSYFIKKNPLMSLWHKSFPNFKDILDKLN